MSIMDATKQMKLFWHRRTMLVMVYVACIMATISVARFFAPDMDLLAFIDIPIITAPLYGLAGILCGIGMLVKNAKASWWLSFSAYLLMLIAASVGIYVDGGLSASLVVLWVSLSLISGLWQAIGASVTLSIAMALGVALSLTNQLGSQHLVLFGVAFILPCVISYIGLRKEYNTNVSENTAYHALARELSTVTNKAEIVINAIGDGVIATDNKGVIQLINPAAQTLIGLNQQDTIDLDYRLVFKLSDAKSEAINDEQDPVQKVLHGEASIATNSLILTSNAGKKMNISLLVSPIGKFGNGAILVFRDITAEISENQQRAEFVSTASHEMRTPVAAIEGYLGLALNPATAQVDDRARMYLTKAHESAQHLGRLFQDLLDVSKADDGRLKNAPSVIDLVAFSRDTMTSLNPKATEKAITLVFQPDVAEEDVNTLMPILYVDVDPDHLREVLLNLIDNAIKYTREGSVAVDVTATDETVTVSITDSGIGIAREDIPHLFQKFYRIDNTDTREIGGTGLGLYLCRRLIESMNGRIWVESEQGKGSTFFVELERISTEEAEKRKSQQVIVPGRATL